MDIRLPPGMEAAQFGQMSARYREDAIQEGWVAYLQALRDHPCDIEAAQQAAWRAAHAYCKREYRRERHQVAASQIDDDHQGSTSLGLGKRRNSTQGLGE